MPEGDTVYLAATRLRAALVGERLTATDFRLPQLATADLAGQTMVDVTPVGKHLFLRTDAGITLHTHFRMQGSWHLYRPGQGWAPPESDVRVVLRTEPWVAVGYRLPVCELLPTEHDQDVVAHLGPDPLGPAWDRDEVVRRFLLEPGREIGTAVLDQTVMAGPGNVYKNEIMFLRGVNPWTPVGEVPDLPGFVDKLAKLMDANRGTGSQITTGDTRPGRTSWVTARAGKPCRRCGTTIRKGAQQSYEIDRPTYWCPRCQPAPTGTPSGPAGAVPEFTSAATPSPPAEARRPGTGRVPVWRGSVRHSRPRAGPR
jgi:formamidopyrimidine-DNA glycosylase